jgi:ABC-2 type transport system permease protein
MRLFISGLQKLARRPATFVTFGLLLGLIVLIILAIGATANSNLGNGGNEASKAAAKALVTFPGAYEQMLRLVLGLGGLFALIYGASIAGSEWTWGTFKSAVARGESRVGYLLNTFASIGLILGLGLLIGYLIAIGAAIVGAHLANVPITGLNDGETLARLPAQLLRAWLALAEEGALGFTIATLARSQLAGIGAGIAFYFGESFAVLFLPDVVKYLPFSVANASVGAVTGTSSGFGGGTSLATLPADQALILVIIWLVGALLVTALYADRAEISG